MKYFIDSEFIDTGKHIELLSLAVVAEDGRQFLQYNRDADLELADEWVIFNVYPHLGVSKYQGGKWYWKEPESRDSTFRWRGSATVVPHSEIRERLKAFVGDDPDVQFIGYYSAYDWVVICQLFGRMVDLPTNFPGYCIDLKVKLWELGKPRIPPEFKSGVSHSAIHDAWWVRRVYEWAYLPVAGE